MYTPTLGMTTDTLREERERILTLLNGLRHNPVKNAKLS
jgi:hypothetical protein